MKFPMQYAKAGVGALIACLTSLQAAAEGGISAAEGLGAAVAFLVAFAAVWAVPNTPADPPD